MLNLNLFTVYSHGLQKLAVLNRGLASCLNLDPNLLRAVIIGHSDMASPSIFRAQSLTRKLQLALTNGRSVSLEQKNLASHIGLLPSAMEERIVEEDRTRRSRAPSPEERCPIKLLDPRPNARRVSPPIELFLCHSLTRYHRATAEPKELRERFMICFKVHKRWCPSYLAIVNEESLERLGEGTDDSREPMSRTIFTLEIVIEMFCREIYSCMEQTKAALATRTGSQAQFPPRFSMVFLASSQ